MSPLSDAILARANVLAWYRRTRRDLPWRRTRDAYAIWISEAMLQQTRVETVRGYWTRFLERFPTVEALAAAEEAEVLALWSGLGYYGRARRLLAAARVVTEEHSGRFPATRVAAEALPGVGAYTAGAVLSIAYGLPEALVDGNVARVFCRFFGLEGDPARDPLKGDLWHRARALVAEGEGDAGDWNQALMELGARVCTARAPTCEACPAADGCAAVRAGRTAELPQLAAARPVRRVEVDLLLVARAGRWLVERRPPGGAMAGLLQFPTVERTPPGGEPSGLFALPDDLLEPGELLGEVRHAITHHRIRARVRAGRAGYRGAREGLGWLRRSALVDAELTGMARKVLRAGFLER
ncbi:MAG: A/G-specific adenine glycosylase [Planctomycetota bacterium]|nr:A/G-specific adenine glycosylase [Planctomycetota bacterium]